MEESRARPLCSDVVQFILSYWLPTPRFELRILAGCMLLLAMKYTGSPHAGHLRRILIDKTKTATKKILLFCKTPEHMKIAFMLFGMHCVSFRTLSKS
jgi:hypothetical protein